MLILKFTMLLIGMLENDVYNLTIAAMIRFVLTFDLSERESTAKKYELVCCPVQKPLLLDHLISCSSHRDNKKGKTIEAELQEKKDPESHLTISSLQLHLGVCIAENFCVVLVEPPESRFTASLDLSDIDHVCRHACAVISIEKKFGFSLSPHRLDALSPAVFALEIINKVARRYSRFPLKQANAFYAARIEQEIVRPNIIVFQAANWASTLKIVLA